MRKHYSFLPEKNFTEKALRFANRYTHVVYLNPNGYSYPYHAFLHVIAFGAWKELKGVPAHNFERLKEFLAAQQDWCFGYFSYDLKNETEQLNSTNPDPVAFPLLNFFVPEHLIFIEPSGTIRIESWSNPEALHEQIMREASGCLPTPHKGFEIRQRILREEYISKINALRQLIGSGDIYEVTFCMEYYAEQAEINPLQVYLQLNQHSPMPFSAYLKIDEQYLLCASPERFLKKEKEKLISQPIKGTARRLADEADDLLLKTSLQNSAKERAENIMIVDLVRNDLSRSAVSGTVKAEEVCGLYSFPGVHQLISTVTAELAPEVHPVEALKQAFPMGSMTGAPKVKAMELIDHYEESARGVFSGAVGYFSPELDFDFNVVIRSILYNSNKRYLSFQAGSAITFLSDAGKEYEECAVKTASIRTILS